MACGFTESENRVVGGRAAAVLPGLLLQAPGEELRRIVTTEGSALRRLTKALAHLRRFCLCAGALVGPPASLRMSGILGERQDPVRAEFPQLW